MCSNLIRKVSLSAAPQEQAAVTSLQDICKHFSPCKKVLIVFVNVYLSITFLFIGETF